jgi:hypothetical protein
MSGALWAGGVVFLSGFLMPALQQAGPAAAGPVMAGLVERRAMTYMPVVAGLTILSGFRLYWIMSDGFGAAYAESAMGLTFLVAGIMATIAFIIGMVVTRPAMTRVATLAQQLPSTAETERPALQAEMQGLRARGRTASLIVAWLVVLAAAGMAVARYL